MNLEAGSRLCVRGEIMGNMKLYCFDVGKVQLDKSFVTAGRGMGQQYAGPVHVFLITHPKGNVLFDTGMDIDVIHNPEKCWGPVAKVFVPIMSKGEDIVSQLTTLGYRPNDIRYVVNSHLHLDHAGGNRLFPEAEFLVQKDELRAAFWPEIYERASYTRSDFDYPLNYHALEGDYDIFGDGSVIIIRAIGHSQGHQFIIVNLKNSGKVVLTGDCCHTKENLEEFVLPILMWNPVEYIRSINKLRELRDKEKAFILILHDPETCKVIKHAPEYYD
jgi:N-acyl homoserine lactone hydrolase